MAVGIALVALAAGCSGDDEGADASSTTGEAVISSTTSSTSTTTSSTSAPPAGETARPCTEHARVSSPAEFDAAAGTYAVTVQAVDPRQGTVEFDVVQWLVGQDAIDAYHQDHPEDPEGPPNDYLVRNESDRLRTAPIRDDAEVSLVRLHEDGNADAGPGTVDELPSYLEATSMGVWWLTFDAGEVVQICEQYTP